MKAKPSMTREESLAEMAAGTHDIMSQEWANAVCEAWGVQPIKARTHRHDPKDFKSALEDCHGVAVYNLALWLCDRLDLEPARKFGRGSQVRACIDVLRAKTEGGK